jgi:sulfofructose kinase
MGIGIGTMIRKRILCAGIAVWDRILAVPALPVGPSKNFASSVFESGGGPAATAAVAIARLGGEATLLARIGDDIEGRRIAEGLAGEGVETANIAVVRGARSMTATVLRDPGGERMIVTHGDPRLVAEPVLPAGCFDVVLGDCRWPEASEAVFRAHDAPRVLDADRAPDKAILHRLLPLATHAIFSAAGLAQATGCDAPRQALARARELTGAWLAVTLGEAGALSLERDGVRAWPAFAVEAVDTTGAGDVFHGAFALALAEAAAIPEAMRFAAAAAAIKCTAPGGRAGIPDRPAIERFLGEHA